jgi:hypothetical protein
MTELAAIVPSVIEIAHRMVWCSVATVDRAGRPRTRGLRVTPGPPAGTITPTEHHASRTRRTDGGRRWHS